MGLGAVVLMVVTSNRVWRRREVAAALQAPVPLSVRSLKLRTMPVPRDVRRAVAQPTADLERLVSFVSSGLRRSLTTQPALALVSVESLGATVLIAVAAACELVRDGARTAIIDPTGSGVFRSLLGEPPPAASEGSGVLVTIVSRADNATGDSTGRLTRGVEVSGPLRFDGVKALPTCDFVLVVARLDPAVGADPVRTWARTAVAVVTSGRSTAQTLVAHAEMLDMAGMHLDAALLVGDSPHDDTVGTVVGQMTILPEPAIDAIVPVPAQLS